MIRRISTKWVLAVLAAVVVPFVGFAVFVETKVSSRLAVDVVRFHLLSLAADLADRIDEELDERRSDVALLASISLTKWFVDDLDDDRGTFRPDVEAIFNTTVREKEVYDYVLAIDTEGRVVGTNTRRADGTEFTDELKDWLGAKDYSAEPWFREAMETGISHVGFHRIDPGLPVGQPAGGWYVGFVHRIDPLATQKHPVGVVLALMNWSFVQLEVARYGVRQLAPEGTIHPVGEDIYASSYAWLWDSDGDTIIAHPRQELYGKRVSTLEGGKLIGLVEAVAEASFGMYPDYNFRDVDKKAAFKHCKSRAAGGFGWVVGVGADDAEIYAPVDELSDWLFTTSTVILTLAVVFTLFIAHRTTRPIRELEQLTRRIASGDLDARIEVRAKDELGQLASSFNRMAAELKENREQLVKAEKEAAWREMARQVAHEIKNPLTPISLSVGLLKRSRDERSPEFDAIFDRTIDMIQRQVENMREVARGFYTFAGEHRDTKPVTVWRAMDAVLELNAALAEERGVRLHPVDGTGKEDLVSADPDELQRALLNLVSNAIEAMPDGGDLYSRVESRDGRVVVEIRDTGTGISPDVAAHLFEPYFTTRSSGTGLGLAIVRRIVEDMGGVVELDNAMQGRGAVARVVLPRDDSQSA